MTFVLGKGRDKALSADGDISDVRTQGKAMCGGFFRENSRLLLSPILHSLGFPSILEHILSHIQNSFFLLFFCKAEHESSYTFLKLSEPFFIFLCRCNEVGKLWEHEAQNPKGTR